MTDKTLDSGIDPERQKLKDAIGESAQDAEVLGHAVMYTVGADWNCIVPRDWLLDRINDLGLPQWLAPGEPRPHYAFDRAIKWMREDWIDDYHIEAPRMDRPEVREDHRVTVDLKEGDGSRIWKVRAEVFFDEEESGQDGGTWAQHDLGYFTYSKDSQAFLSRQSDQLDEEHHLYRVWEDLRHGGNALFRRMQKNHIAQDIRKMMYNASNNYTNNTIQLRRAVYLYPAGMADFVEKMAILYSDINREFKEVGEPVAVRTVEVLDTDDKREWIEHQVRETLEDNIEGVLDSAFEEFDEGQAADQVVKTIKRGLDPDSETAEVYNSLLEAEITLEEVLEEQKSRLANEQKSDIIDRVMDQADIDEFS